jgi:tetratricopeptide (TPR) repeat protein
MALSLLLVFGLSGPAARAASIHSTLTDAQMQFEQAHYDQALELYQKANEVEPGHAAIEYNIGLCRLYLGEAEKAIQVFEGLASRSDVNQSLRRDAFYNVGLVRARGAHGQLKELFAPATQPSDRKPTPDDPASIPKLQAIADELLRAIAGFRKSVEVQDSDDAAHNIRAVRITRRDVLGLLRKAAEAKQKDDILKDPRAYLEALILEQGQQASLSRLLILNGPKEPAHIREARRAGVRAQRKIMESTGTFADQLSQFREANDQGQPGATSAPASRPAEGTSRERVYRAVARQIGVAIESQREACAFLLDGEIDPAHEQQSAACEQMHAALYMFPLEPGQALVKAAVEQAALRELVDSIKAAEDWLCDPLVPRAVVPKDAAWNAEKAPIHVHQSRVGAVLALLRRQCEHVATTSQPAEQAADPQEPPEPMLDPELNRKLADALKGTDALVEKALSGIAARDQKPTVAAQDELLKLIEAAIDLLPKTLEQRITELIVRQGRLNAEVQAEAGQAGDAPTHAVATAMDEVRKWTTRLKSRLLGNSPAKLAEEMSGKQKTIRTDTVAVDEEVKQKIPAGAGAQAAPSPAASQPAELKAYIEASKHLAEATGQMDAGLEGFEQTVVEDLLRPMQPGGPVQAAQGKALEELVKALAALKPPASQPSEDQDEQQKQDQPQEQQEQDRQRELDRMDKEREQAERELYQRRPRTVIKDW